MLSTEVEGEIKFVGVLPEVGEVGDGLHTCELEQHINHTGGVLIFDCIDFSLEESKNAVELDNRVEHFFVPIDCKFVAIEGVLERESRCSPLLGEVAHPID